MVACSSSGVSDGTCGQRMNLRAAGTVETPGGRRIGISENSLFTDTEDVITIGIRALRWLSLGYIGFAVSQVLQGAMRGAGETMAPMWISIIYTIVIRLPLAYILPMWWQLDGEGRSCCSRSL